MRTTRRPRWSRALPLAAALLAVGHAAATRRVREARTSWDEHVLALPATAVGRERRVRAADGIELHVCEYGDPDSAVTVVLAHGWTLSSRLWSRQVAPLSAVARVVTYDHRGHGRSDRTVDDACSVDQLGADLGTVLDAVAPRGDLVLVGHSMGGMTLMHLAAQRPALFAQRVRGVALVSTSAGELADLDLGLPRPVALLLRRFGAQGMGLLGRLERWAEPGRTAPPEMWLALRRLNFGPDAPARLVDEMLHVVSRTPLGVVASFYAALLSHDGTPGLPVLGQVPVTVLVGEHDRLTPPAHARRLVGSLPAAALQVVPGAGHMVTIERPDVVTDAVLGLVRSPSLTASA